MLSFCHWVNDFALSYAKFLTMLIVLSDLIEEEKIEEREEFSALPDFRARILPVLGTIPSMFGMAIATYIILRISEYPDIDPLPIKLREGLYVRMHRELLTREAKTFNEK